MRFRPTILFFGGSPSQPQAAPFRPIDIKSAGDLTTQYDTLGYQTADADFLSRFPGLVQQRNSNITNAVKQLTGPLDPTVENSFAKTGLASSLNSFGGTGGLGIGGQGSAAKGAISASIAQQADSKQQNDEGYLQQLLADNPQRSFGPSGDDVVNWMIGNTIGHNQAAYQNYQGSVGAANAGNAQSQSELFSGASLAVSLIGIAAAI